MAFTITTVNGSQTLEGTSGVDTASLTAASSYTLNAYESDDLVTVNTGLTVAGSFSFGNGNDQYWDSTTASTYSAVTFGFGQGSDTFFYNAALGDGVVIQGGQGIDTITTGAFGATANAFSAIRGGKGSDIIQTGNITGNSAIYGGNGDDNIRSGGLISNSNIYGGSGADSITVGAGGDGSGQVFGGDGLDTILSTADAAGLTIFGDAGNDVIRAGSATDVIYGGAGDDSINAGGGVDQISGGAGTNTFIFTAGTGTPTAATDVITDWQSGTDNVIDYSVALTKLVGAGINNAGFITNVTTLGNAVTAFNAIDTTAGQSAIWNDGSNSYLIIGDGSDAADIIQLSALVATNYTINAAGDVTAFA